MPVEEDLEIRVHKISMYRFPDYIIEEARTRLQTLGWNASPRFGRQETSTTYLQQFLGTVWLSTDTIDIMMEGLSARVESDSKVTDVTIATLAFSRDVLAASKGKKKPLLDRYECEVREGKKKRIVFPKSSPIF
ncbi:hypothetical protein B0H14DRAFT_2619120 [Mycena olivaceomarginata]|nr:hypothetical protein B0H14DRAFT_2619120 [Mycena olivaceomarginata]